MSNVTGTASDMIDVSNHYLVSGRISGDDDDQCLVVKAESLGDAEELFKDRLRIDADRSGAEVYVIYSAALGRAIREAVVGIDS